MSEEEQQDVLKKLEKEYSATSVIYIVQREGQLPRVEWPETISENDVIASLFKALLFMTVDDFIYDLFENMAEGEDEP